MHKKSYICVSIVSHGHGEMLLGLINELVKYDEIYRIVVTKNIPEDLNLNDSNKIIVVSNDRPLGFGHNHNNAFLLSDVRDGNLFCVLNPDISLVKNPFVTLSKFIFDSNAALAAPLVLSPEGAIEDSARNFPTLISLIKRYNPFAEEEIDIPSDVNVLFPDWLAGMFLLFNSIDYELLGGFDEKFYLYCEDVDICARIWNSGKKLGLCSQVYVCHDARRHSQKKIKFLIWHLTSLAYLTIKYFGVFPRIRKLKNEII